MLFLIRRLCASCEAKWIQNRAKVEPPAKITSKTILCFLPLQCISSLSECFSAFYIYMNYFSLKSLEDQKVLNHSFIRIYIYWNYFRMSSYYIWINYVRSNQFSKKYIYIFSSNSFIISMLEITALLQLFFLQYNKLFTYIKKTSFKCNEIMHLCFRNETRLFL